MNTENISKVRLGSTVKIRLKSGEIKIYTVVDSSHTDPPNGFISNTCPIGQALLGSTVGEKKSYEINGNVFEVEVVEIA